MTNSANSCAPGYMDFINATPDILLGNPETCQCCEASRDSLRGRYFDDIDTLEEFFICNRCLTDDGGNFERFVIEAINRSDHLG